MQLFVGDISKNCVQIIAALWPLTTACLTHACPGISVTLISEGICINLYL